MRFRKHGHSTSLSPYRSVDFTLLRNRLTALLSYDKREKVSGY